MKKLQGFADPITLGFVLVALLGATGVTTTTKMQHQEPKLANHSETVAKANLKTVPVNLTSNTEDK